MTTPTSDDLRLTRLPAWARDEIKGLRRRLATANAKLAVGPEDSDTIADPLADTHGGVPTPLGRGTRVLFLLRPDDPQPGVVAYTKDGSLVIQADRAIHIRPFASNMVSIAMDPRRPT